MANPLSSLLSSIGSLEVTWKVLDPEIFYAMAFTTTSYVFTSRIQKLVKEHTHVIFPCCIQDHWLIFYTELLSDGTAVLTSLNSLGGWGTSVARRHLIRILSARVPGGPTFPSAWRCVEGYSPQQNNGYDCGVYAIGNIIHLGYRAIAGYPLRFSWNIKTLRRRIASLLGTPWPDAMWHSPSSS